MRKIPIILILLSVAVFYVGFILFKLHKSSSPNPPNVEHIKAKVAIKRFERTLFALKDRAAIEAFLKKEAIFAQKFLQVESEEDLQKMAGRLWEMTQNPHIQKLYEETQTVFDDKSIIHQQLEQGFKYLKFYYPDLKLPQVVTFITGLTEDLYVDKDLIVIGLDFFLGKGAKFQPNDIPTYMLIGYQPTHVVPKVMLLISKWFNKTNKKAYTMLADMLYFGKSYYFAQALLPSVKVETFLDYTSQQISDAHQYRKKIWKHFLDNNLLYEENPMLKKNYLGDQPATLAIGPLCPPRIGAWLGWEIVKQYLKNNPKVTLQTLMGMTDSQQIFSLSKFKP